MQQELWIYGQIGHTMFEDGITATFIRDELKKADPRYPILVRINSPGGDVFEAVAIHTLLSQWPAGVDVTIDGLAASAASYIATVGRHVSIAPGAFYMIHEAWTVTVGNAADHQKQAELLDTISEAIVSAYVTKSGRSRAEVRQAMKKDTWFTAAGAVEFGLCDSIIGERAANTIADLQRQLDEMRV